MEKSRFYLSVFVTVAALSMAACGDDGSGGGNNINDNTNDNTNDNNNNNDNSNNNNNVNVGPLEITQVNPADGDTDVFIDETIRLTFSRNLDPMTVDEVSVKVTTDGEDAVGRLVTDRQTILFTPAEFEPSAIYTLSVSTDVSDASGVTMDEEFTSTFTTGTTAKDGSDPMDDSALDLIRKPFIYTTRKQEYVLLGVDHSNVGKDLFVVDPLAFNEMTPEPTEPIPYSVEDSSLNTYDIKMAAVGNLDDDVYDEVVYLTQGYSSSTGRGGGRGSSHLRL